MKNSNTDCNIQQRPLVQPEVLILKKNYYVLTKEYSYTWDLCGYISEGGESRKMVKVGKEKIVVENQLTIPKGFRWDGASVPSFLWWLGFWPDGKHRAAALVHDFIYIYKGKLPAEYFKAKYEGHPLHSQYGSFSRKDCDRLFKKMMKDAGVCKCKRYLMFLAVRWFGSFYWKDSINWLSIIIKLILVGMFIYLFVREVSGYCCPIITM